MLGVSRMAMATYLLVLSIVGAFETIEKDEVPQYNPYPCMPSPNRIELNRIMHKTFLKHHLPPYQPNLGKPKEWQNFLKDNDLCLRPTQSFLHDKEKQNVLDVCSPTGGKTLCGDLCISKRQFSFYTVHIDTESCKVKTVKFKKNHIILTCNEISQQCLPVHFEENPQDMVPKQSMRDCKYSL